ncbi:peptide methionine sulfoxide reductase-like [Montipora capricornis]|uniref:peptide methionine sulfoxide reductase-like n=1 Tax=Montipora capricornis TaxID=246305 RepID=UPI0035F1A5D8
MEFFLFTTVVMLSQGYCEENGNHTETVQMEYDPNRTTYTDLLEIFWKNHDATTSHKAQYMSAIFYHDEEQKQLAEKTRDQYQKTLRRPIVTKILPAKTFYDAEDYHQKYLLRQHPTLLKSLGLNGVELVSSFVAARLNGYVGGYGSLKNFEAEVDELKISDAQADMVQKILKNKRF